MKNKITVSSLEIQQAWKALTRQGSVGRRLSDTSSRRMAEAGWVANFEITDALADMDGRLNHTWLADVPEITKRIGLEAETCYLRTWKYADEIIGRDKLTSSDVLRFFWWLERLGFPLDVGSFCDAVAGTLPQTRYLSESHLDVLLYLKERYSQLPVELMAQDMGSSAIARTESFTAANGVVVEIGYDQSDQAISLVSKAPHYSAPQEWVSTTCEACAFTFIRGRKGDEDEHAIHHRKTIEPISPRPSRAWKASVERDPETVWVDADSPRWMHIAMYRRAKAFQREFNYDFLQWSDHPDANEGGVAFAFLDDAHRMIGGCRFQIGGGADGRNRLHWIWFCPEARRQGQLSRAWPRLRARMGDFDLEPPVSPAMQAFMKARDAHS